LDVTLIDAEILEVDQQAVSEEHPKRGLRQRRAEIAEAEFAVGRGDVENLRRAAGHFEQQYGHAGERTADEHHRLHDPGPDHRFGAAEQRVNQNDEPGPDDNEPDIPAGERHKGEGEQIENGAQPGDLREQVTGDRVGARPRPEARFEVMVGRNFTVAPVERHEPPARDPHRQRQRKGGHEARPVAGKRSPRHGEKTDTTHIGTEDRQADGPAGEGAPGRHETLALPVSQVEPTAIAGDADKVNSENEEVEAGECFQAWDGVGCRLETTVHTERAGGLRISWNGSQ
jgi:hypothetical protein